VVIGNATIYRVRTAAGADDRYGDPTAGTETRTLLTECAVAPRESADVSDAGRRGVIVGLNLYAPYGTDLLHTDQVEVDGVLYEADGEPGQWKSPLSSWEAGMEIALRRVQG
jgi:hypothetical protein